jgi:transcriptional regulator with XRE-family HTH domain
MELPPDALLAANALIHRHGAGAEEFAAKQLWNSIRKDDERSAAKWLSMLEALKQVRERKTKTKHGSHGKSALAQDLGRRIGEVRLQRGWTQHDLGAKLGVSGQQIQKYEIGQNAVPLHRLLDLAKIFGVSPEALWTQADAAAVIPGVTGAADLSTLQLVRAYRQIGDEKVRKRLLQLVKTMAGDHEESTESPVTPLPEED